MTTEIPPHHAQTLTSACKCAPLARRTMTAMRRLLASHAAMARMQRVGCSQSHGVSHVLREGQTMTATPQQHALSACQGSTPRRVVLVSAQAVQPDGLRRQPVGQGSAYVRCVRWVSTALWGLHRVRSARLVERTKMLMLPQRAQNVQQAPMLGVAKSCAASASPGRSIAMQMLRHHALRA